MHVYDRVQEYENDEIDNSSNSNNATSDKSVSNGKNSSLYKMCISVNSVMEFPGAGLGRLITINSELNGAI